MTSHCGLLFTSDYSIPTRMKQQRRESKFRTSTQLSWQDSSYPHVCQFIGGSRVTSMTSSYMGGEAWRTVRKGRFAHRMQRPCRATKGLECLPHLIYTARPCLIHTCHAMLRPCRSSQGHSTAVKREPCCSVALRRTAWSEHGMVSVNQTRPHCVNQTGKTF